MSARAILVAVVALSAFCAVGVQAGSNPDHPAKTYVVDLDDEPSKRWVHIVTDLRADINVTFEYLVNTLLSNEFLLDHVESLRKAVKEGGAWSDEDIAEMQGISDALGINMTYLEYANLFYEYATLGPQIPGMKDFPFGWKFCTSIVAQTTDGEILHARNQDYNIKGLPNITIDVQVKKKGEVIFTGTTFACYIGFPTIMRHGGWSITVDSRITKDPFANVKSAREGGLTIGVFLRRMAENLSKYDQVIDSLNTTRVIAPAYYIVAGAKPGEGAVVTRSRDGPDNSHGMGIWSLDPPSAWYRLETNFDPWWPDLLTDGRRRAAVSMMEFMGQDNLSFDQLFHLLSIPPVHAVDTVYTALMQPSKSYYNATIRLA